MSSDDIDTMLGNLEAIKNGEDPRDSPEESQSAAASTTQSKPLAETNDSLELMKGEVDRLYDEMPELEDSLSRQKVHCGVSRNDGRNGVCKYGKRLTKRRFNKQITGTKRASGHVVIVVNEKILEQGNRDDFLDTVRHELAHAVAYGKHAMYPSRKKDRDYDPYYKGHGRAWKKMARKLGCDASSCHNKRDRSNEFKYFISCPNPNCDMKTGRTKRCKVIKQPFNRMCQKCGESTLVSHDAGTPVPTENGTVAVESLPWDNRDEWNQQGRP